MSIIIDIFNKDVNIFNIYWHRVVIDEFHEIEDSNLFLKLKFLESNYRWIISGTPFKEKQVLTHTEIDKTSLSSVIDYLSFGLNKINTINIFDKLAYSYVKNHFSRNTHNKNIKILKLPEIKEETIWLNFTETERMIYNAYLADPNNTVNDIFLRQLCCHPLISEKIRENIVSNDVMRIVQEGMRQTITSGTAQSLKNLPVEAAGKTGTAQFGGENKTHAWFVSYAPFNDPEIAMAVLAPHQHGKWLVAAALLHLGQHVADGQPDSGDIGAVSLRAVHDPQVVH
jgi:hypothetical protein